VDDSEIAFDEQGLVPCVVQDWRSGEVLTLAYMNAESLRLTRETGEIHFYSRSRQELWHKGATSGNTQTVKSIRYDCDGDALLALVEPTGPACHTGERTCFHRGELEPLAPHEALPTLERTIDSRADTMPAGARRCWRRPMRSCEPPATSPTSVSPRRRRTSSTTSRCCSADAGCRSST